jgi:hypothetical protein
MDRNKAIHRTLRAARRIVVCAVGIVLASAVPATAAQLDQHNDLVNTYITTMHADPLVADCAAHGNFVAGTSSVIDHVEFSAQSFDSAHATVTPWNDSFDEGKQRVKVDTVVSVNGVGIPQNSNDAPLNLTFRCGYVGNQMLAFSWNDPVPAAHARSERAPSSSSSHASGKHGKQAVGGKGKGKGKATSKGVKKGATGKGASKSSANSASKSRGQTTKVAANNAVKKTTTAKKKPG